MAICPPYRAICRSRTRRSPTPPAFFEAGVTPIFLGGDHSVSLPLLRAAVAALGQPLALLHFDSHGDIWSGYYGGLDTHGTPFRRALEEDLIDVRHSIQIGLRGSVYDENDIPLSRELGFQVVTARELHRRGVDDVLQQVQELLRGRTCYLSFDIDFVDPAFAPGTGTPETGGFSSATCHELLRGLRGLHFVAFDMVEVLPSYDPAGITALLAANLVYEFIALLALQHRDATTGQSYQLRETRSGFTPPAARGCAARGRCGARPPGCCAAPCRWPRACPATPPAVAPA